MGADLPIRDAATIILVRDIGLTPRILMGQRGKSAAFMPEKYVFPGGAVDRSDGDLPFARPLEPVCQDRLNWASEDVSAEALAGAAIRELWEETGQCLGSQGVWRDPPKGWRGFAEKGLLPDAGALNFFFRAITPPGRPRRFDARFFLADAAALATDPDDFGEAEDELAHLHWVGLDDALSLDLPFITRVVLAELARHLPRLDAPVGVPFVRNDRIDADVIWL